MAEMVLSAEELVAKHERELYGANGTMGLLTRLSLLEDAVHRIETSSARIFYAVLVAGLGLGADILVRLLVR